MEMGSSSTRENPHEAAGSVPAIEVVVPKTSTPFAPRGNALATVKDKDARGATSFSVDLAEEISHVVRVLMD